MNLKPLLIGTAIVAAAYFLLKPDGMLSNLLNSMAGGSAEGGGGNSGYPDSPYYRLTDEQPPSYWQEDTKQPDTTPTPTPPPDITPTPTPQTDQPATINPNRPSYVDTIDNIGTVAIAAGGTAWAAKEILGSGRGAKLLEVAKNYGKKGAEAISKVARNPTAQKLTLGLAAGYGVKRIIDTTPGAENWPKADNPIDWVKDVTHNISNFLTGKKDGTATTDNRLAPPSLSPPAPTISINSAANNVLQAAANPNRPSGSSSSGVTRIVTSSGGYSYGGGGSSWGSPGNRTKSSSSSGNSAGSSPTLHSRMGVK